MQVLTNKEPTMLLTSITLQDIGTLEEIHAVLTDNGWDAAPTESKSWVIPEWLIYLKEEVERKMKQ